MKNKQIIPNTTQINLPEHEQIVSKTDLTGRITYANRTFMRIANFQEKALLDVQHNIVRHPDMPRGVYQFMWETLKRNEEFFGFVKNLTADGAYYWVFANVTPDYDHNGNAVGYFSVRRRPSAKGVQVMEALYREMCQVEADAGPVKAMEASRAFLAKRLKALGQAYEPLVLSLQLDP
jgi:PAS domain S-box-containing protein